MTMADKIDLATKELRGFNYTHIIWLVCATATIIYTTTTKLDKIEAKIDVANIQQIYQHRADSVQNKHIESRLDRLEKPHLAAMVAP